VKKDEILQINRFSHLHDGEKVFFCKTDYIYQLFQFLKNRNEPCIIITGNSDYSIVDKIVNDVPKCVRKWYAQNNDTSSNLLESIPIGLENTIPCSIPRYGVIWEHAKEKVEFISNSIFDTEQEGVYCNFNVNTYPERKNILSICQETDYIKTGRYNNNLNSSFASYADELTRHEMVICPRGNGLDTHRLWETLYLQRVPIVKFERSLKIFEELPILFLENWEQLKDKEIIYQRFNSVKKNSRKMLNFSYWSDKIKKEKELL
jgi:hypothetical protein